MKEAVQESLNGVKSVVDVLNVDYNYGKRLDRATISLFPDRMLETTAKTVLEWVLDHTDWLPERVSWSWRGEITVYAIFLVRRGTVAEEAPV